MSQLGNHETMLQKLYPRREKSKAPAALRQHPAGVNTTTPPLSARSSRTQSDDAAPTGHYRTNVELANPFSIISPHVHFHPATRSPSVPSPSIVTPFPVKSSPTETIFMTTESTPDENEESEPECAVTIVPASSFRTYLLFFAKTNQQAKVLIKSTLLSIAKLYFSFVFFSDF
eukprot:GHVP01004504.1.p1 GENE.GHVP01004504.1~~GHVP01004504.1.p1  ORF type:complete len:173 (-),score=14.12 GHVP01004504.1:428-946(-)